MSKQQKTLAAALLTGLILTACGGGGSDASPLSGSSNSASSNSSVNSSATQSSANNSSAATSSLASSSLTSTASSMSSSASSISSSSSSKSSSSSSSISSSSSSTSSSTSSSVNSSATVATASGGYADVRSGGVTGGGSATAITVTTAAGMQAAIDAYDGSSGLVIKYTGTFNFDSITDACTQWQLSAGDIVEVKNKSNVTIEGANGSGANFGIAIKGGSENVIVRNMTIGLLPGSIDAIGIEGQSSKYPGYIWIDHNTLFSSLKECDGAGDLEFDGLIDSKAGAHHITYSYNYIHDHHKVGLIGSSDSDISDRFITFHHNYYYNIGSRVPLQRGGYTHIYNNLFSSIVTSGANIRMGGYALIEGNYFEQSYNPVTSRDSATVGYWELRNNNITSTADFSTYGITWGSCSGSYSTDKCLKNANDWTSTATFPKTIPYNYTANTPACVKSGLPSVAGAGKGLATLNCAASGRRR